MPFYKFTITLQDRSVHSGLRELLDQPDLNAVWRKYEEISRRKYGQTFESFRVVMLSKLDPEVKAFLAERGNTFNDWNVEKPDGSIKPPGKRDKSNQRDWGKEQREG